MKSTAPMALPSSAKTNPTRSSLPARAARSSSVWGMTNTSSLPTPAPSSEHTRQVIYLNDNEMAVIKTDSFRTTTIDDIKVSPVISQLENKLEEYELGGYEHFMLKEIFRAAQRHPQLHCAARAEQREGRIVLGGMADHTRELVKARHYILTAQGNRMACRHGR